MAQSMRLASCFALGLLLTACGTTSLTKSSSQRLSDVLSTEEQAETAYRANDMQRAAVLYQQLTRLIPQEADYWYMLGNTYVRTQQPDQAVQAYQLAIARNPNHTRAWHNLGIVRMRQAMAAFVSSASTAKADDPMREVSNQLADELASIGLGGGSGGKPQDQSKRLPVTTSRPPPPSPGKTAATSSPWPDEPYRVRRKPGTPASTDRQ